MARYVLDSYAILALLSNEPGANHVANLLHQAESGEVDVLMSLVNLGEVAYIVERRWGADQCRTLLAYLDQTAIQFVDATRTIVLTAAHLKAHHPMSYADTFAAALAMHEHATLITGDPEYQALADALDIDWLQRQDPD